jgi:glycerol-3-phosphate acyltransferase PlsX
VIRVALDAMGGDHAPRAEVDGALAAIEAHPDLHLQLVG